MTDTIAHSEPARPAAPGVNRRPKSWSDEEIRTLAAMWATSTNAEIAQKLNRPANAVAIKASRIGLPRKDEAARMLKSAKKGVKVRNCLTCRTPFYSEGAHNRICDPCKDSNSEYDTDYIVRMGGPY